MNTVTAPRKSASAAGSLDPKRQIDLYRQMLRIRLIEEAIADHYAEGEMRCPVHLSIGQEAIAVGTCAALETSDKVYSTHRCHAHYLAKGGDLKRMMAEICGKAAGLRWRPRRFHAPDGCSEGRHGEHSDRLKLYSSRCRQRACRQAHAQREVTVAFFGDASVEEGVFHESANFASLHKLPVIFLCENNLYSVFTHLDQRQPKRPLTDLAKAHGMLAAPRRRQRSRRMLPASVQAVDARAKIRARPFWFSIPIGGANTAAQAFDNHIGYREPRANTENGRSVDPIAGFRAHILGAS